MAQRPSVSSLRGLLAEAAAAGSRGDPLKPLLDAIEREADRLQQDVDRLYDELLIDQEQPWAVRYIGPLIGVGGICALGLTVYICRRESR